MDLKLKKQFKGETNLDVFVWDENNNVAFTGAYVNWLEKQCTLTDVVKSLPTICKNFIDGQCNECELNEHKECND